MSKTYIACDLGKSGYFCLMSFMNLQTIPMPKIGKEIDFHAICNILKSSKDDNIHVVFERLFAVGKNQHSGMSMGRQAGNLEGMCIALNIPYTIVSPQTWQKVIFEGIPKIPKADGKNDTKAQALIAVKRLFPELNLLRTPKCKKPDDGMIDSVLLAKYATIKNL